MKNHIYIDRLIQVFRIAPKIVPWTSNFYDLSRKELCLTVDVLFNKTSANAAIAAHEFAHVKQRIPLWVHFCFKIVFPIAITAYFHSLNGAILAIISNRLFVLLYEAHASILAIRLLESMGEFNIKVVRLKLLRGFMTYINPVLFCEKK